MRLFRRGPDPFDPRGLPVPGDDDDEAEQPDAPAEDGEADHGADAEGTRPGADAEDGPGSGDGAEPKPKRKRHWLRWTAVVVVLLLAGGGGYGYWLYRSVEEDVQTQIDEVEPPEEPEDPFNALLIGSDSRAGLTPEEQLELGAAAVAGERADTIILAHIDPETDRIVMVQFPRDLYVPIDGGGEDKINASLVDGDESVVRTVEDLTGVEINSYAKVDIAGFRQIVDAIDGVDVCITEPIPFDPNTGLEVPEPGLVHFDADEALAFVRSRRFTTGDFQRIQNQQKFLASAIKKVTSVGSLLRLDRVQGIANALRDHLTIDEHTSLRELLDLGQKLRNFNPDNYEAYTVPNLGITNVDPAGSVILPDDDGMQVLFEAIADNRSPAEADGVPDIDPSTITVAVTNGTSTVGAAAEAWAALEQATSIEGGPLTAGAITEEKRTGFGDTTVLYEEGDLEKAELVDAALPGALVKEGEVADGADVEVIVERDFETQRLVKLTPIPIPPPSDPPPACASGRPVDIGNGGG